MRPLSTFFYRLNRADKLRGARAVTSPGSFIGVLDFGFEHSVFLIEIVCVGDSRILQQFL